MRRELYYPFDYEIADSFSCLADSIGTASNVLCPSQPINANRLAMAIPEINDIYVANLFDLIEHHISNGLRHKLLEINSEDGDLFLDLIMRSLCSGALIELGVWTNDWLELLGMREKRKRDDAHSIVVVGIYQPLENKLKKTWFYISDSYSQRHLFLPASDVFDCREDNGKLIWLSIFHHSSIRLDPEIETKAINSGFKKVSVQKKIRRRFQKENGRKRAPFNWLFAKE